MQGPNLRLKQRWGVWIQCVTAYGCCGHTMQISVWWYRAEHKNQVLLVSLDWQSSRRCGIQNSTAVDWELLLFTAAPIKTRYNKSFGLLVRVRAVHGLTTLTRPVYTWPFLAPVVTLYQWQQDTSPGLNLSALTTVPCRTIKRREWTRIYLSLRFNGHFPAGPGLSGTRMSPFWILLELRLMEVVVTTGAIRRAKLQSYHHHQHNQHPVFLQAGCPSCRPTSGVGTLKGNCYEYV